MDGQGSPEIPGIAEEFPLTGVIERLPPKHTAALTTPHSKGDDMHRFTIVRDEQGDTYAAENLPAALELAQLDKGDRWRWGEVDAPDAGARG